MSASGRVLVVDDEKVVRDSLAGWLREDGHACRTAASGEDALEAARSEDYDVCVVDLKMPRGLDGIETMRRMKEAHPGMAVVIITAYATVDTAVEAMKGGAEDYLVKPFAPEDVSAIVERVVTLRRVSARAEPGGAPGAEVRFCGMVSRNPQMHRLFEMAREVADLRSTVLIEGESGTGKELVARAIHESGHRRDGPYVQLSCAALPETLLESELFGYERGAFTGAVGRRPGKFELASGGTLLLDEIPDVGPKVQSDLLRVLQERRLFRLGGTEEIAVDVRFIAATNRPLHEAVQSGRFREDLFFRLNVIHLEVPPLRRRLEDVEPLARDFIATTCHESGRSQPELTRAALERLCGHSWPGNVRELENAIERALVTCRGPRLDAPDFYFLGRSTSPDRGFVAPSHLSLKEVELEVVRAVLRRTSGNISEAASILGIDRSTLYEKMRRYGIERTGDDGTAPRR